MPAQVKGLSKIESATGRASFFGFTKVVSLTFETDYCDSIFNSSVCLIMETRKPKDNFRVQMRFIGVTNFNLREFGGYTQISGFDIVDISDRQWEGVNFMAMDHEHQNFHLMCKTAEVEYVEKVE